MVLNIKKKPKSNVFIGDNSIGFSKSTGGMRLIVKSSNYIIADRLAKLYNLYKVACCKKINNKHALVYSVLSNY